MLNICAFVKVDLPHVGSSKHNKNGFYGFTTDLIKPRIHTDKSRYILEMGIR